MPRSHWLPRGDAVTSESTATRLCGSDEHGDTALEEHYARLRTEEDNEVERVGVVERGSWWERGSWPEEVAAARGLLWTVAAGAVFPAGCGGYTRNERESPGLK
uniref:Uncharacterized protein n=1 Tax=Knipowitschia caucasica TaxID=637954 RepID=A0AAV2LQF7_KNICA